MLARRLLLLLAAFVACLAANAATVEQRSPFRQGHWWDPTRSGHGFEILNAGGQVMLVWYTYDENSRPIWYTAQGDQHGPQGLGSLWTLQKHRWDGGRIVESTGVGNMHLRVDHFERITASWQIRTSQGAWTNGTWTLEPFVQSGTANEVDLTGHWFNPAASGWGMTLVDQGDVFGAVIYAYDAAGEPTWVAGFDRGKGTTIELFSMRGACPSCENRPTGTLGPAGTIRISYRGDNEVTVIGSPAIELPAGLRIDGARVVQLGRPASTRRVDTALVPFATEQALRSFLVNGMDRRVFYGGGIDFSPAPPSADATAFSTTNLQESGVDEADFVKSDGRYVYAVAPAVGAPGIGGPTARKVRIAYVGDGASTLEPRGEFPLYAGTDPYATGSLYVHDGKLVTLASRSMGPWGYSPSPTSETTIEIHGLSNPEMPASRWRAKLSGAFVSSRRIGDRMYVVTRFTPNLPGYNLFPYNDGMRAANRAVVEAAPTSALLPSISENGRPAVAAVSVTNVYAPQLGARGSVADMTVVTVVDIREARVVQTLAVAGKTDTLYVSTSNLYLASSRYEVQDRIGISPPAQPALYVTDIHQIAIRPQGLEAVATGSVEGTVGYGEMAPFRFGEHEGRLRVVTSTGTGGWGPQSVNRLTILEPSSVAPGLLRTVSFLPNARRPERIGKPNEFLHSTRFVGDRLYAVTFKKVDPLYVIDLSDGSDPKIAGALEIPGFSDYLHPLANGVLLGFGKDTKPSDSSADGGQFAWYQGLHLTLFDISNPSAPRQIQRHLMGKRGSESPLLHTHHAFSALPRADGALMVAIPAQIHEGGTQFSDWETAPWSHSGLLRFEVRGTTPGDARITQLQTLVSDSAPTSGTYPPYDSENSARSVLFPAASVLVSRGRFFRIDNDLGTQSGPY